MRGFHEIKENFYHLNNNFNRAYEAGDYLKAKQAYWQYIFLRAQLGLSEEEKNELDSDKDLFSDFRTDKAVFEACVKGDYETNKDPYYGLKEAIEKTIGSEI